MKKNEWVLGWLAIGILSLVLAGCSGKNVQPTEETATPATGAPGGKTVDAETSGEITGSVKLHGVPPEAKHVNTAAMVACAKGNIAPGTSDEVVTGDGGTLANVFVYVKSGLESYAFPVPSEPARIDQKGCQFVPHVVTLQTGQGLEVVNSDASAHNIHPVSKNNREWNMSQAPGESPFVKSFARPEIAIPVKCNIHPWMKAYIAVGANPYFQVTGNDGAFELKNLPPGTYTLAVWHELYGTSEQSVTIGPKESKTVAFIFEAAATRTK